MRNIGSIDWQRSICPTWVPLCLCASLEHFVDFVGCDTKLFLFKDQTTRDWPGFSFAPGLEDFGKPPSGCGACGRVGCSLTQGTSALESLCY